MNVTSFPNDYSVVYAHFHSTAHDFAAYRGVYVSPPRLSAHYV